MNPTIYANLTMPWVNYIESVVAPVSVTGSGKYLNLVGQANFANIIWSDLSNTRTYALGDVVDVKIGFRSAVLFPDGAYLLIDDSTSSANTSRRAYFGARISDTTILFPLVVQHQDD